MLKYTPHPVKGLFVIEGLDPSINTEIILFDSKGSRILSRKNSADQSIQIDISSLSTSEYFITDGNSKAKMIIIMIKEKKPKSYKC